MDRKHLTPTYDFHNWDFIEREFDNLVYGCECGAIKKVPTFIHVDERRTQGETQAQS
jgi:hypothetical protein